MSEENVQLVRTLFSAAAQGDTATVFSIYDEDVEFDITRSPLPRLVGGTAVWRGHEGLRAFFQERSEQVDEIEDVCDELIDAGDQVVSLVTTRARGRASGVEVDSPQYAAVWTVRDGKVIRVVWLATREEALDAAGLAE